MQTAHIAALSAFGPLTSREAVNERLRTLNEDSEIAHGFSVLGRIEENVENVIDWLESTDSGTSAIAPSPTPVRAVDVRALAEEAEALLWVLMACAADRRRRAKRGGHWSSPRSVAADGAAACEVAAAADRGDHQRLAVVAVVVLNRDAAAVFAGEVGGPLKLALPDGLGDEVVSGALWRPTGGAASSDMAGVAEVPVGAARNHVDRVATSALECLEPHGLSARLDFGGSAVLDQRLQSDLPFREVANSDHEFRGDTVVCHLSDATGGNAELVSECLRATALCVKPCFEVHDASLGLSKRIVKKNLNR